jgi:hypothetical protein
MTAETNLKAADAADPVAHRARKILDRQKTMWADKQLWFNLYQVIGQYVHMRKQNFTSQLTPGQSEVAYIFDDSAPFANSQMAASILGYLWPNGAKSFNLGMPFDMEDELEQMTGSPDTEEIKKYYEWASKRMAAYMDNPKSGLGTSLDEYMLDQGAFGFSGIKWTEQDDLEVPIAYSALDAKHLAIAEGANGFVNTLYILKSYNLTQLVEEYGYENISSRWQKAYDQGDSKQKVKVLQAIEPRVERNPYGFGKKNMPFASIHIDMDTEKIMRESGFFKLPGAVCRFWKAMNEIYGRSPAMNALPSILEANALGQAYPLAVEKNLEPTLVVQDDSVMGSGKIDTSAGAIITVSMSGRMNHGQKAIEPLVLTGEPEKTLPRRTELRQIIQSHFFQDQLQDQNRDPRMTLGEYQGRTQTNSRNLNTVFQRQYAEVFVPMIEATFAILLRKGLLGVIQGGMQDKILQSKGITPRYLPDPVAKRIATGQNVYKINFISPAIQSMNAQELDGITQTLNSVNNLAPNFPNVLDIPDLDWTIRRVQELTGAPREMINSMEAIQSARKARAQMQAQQAQSNQARQDSETARNVAQAGSTLGMAQNSGQVGTAAK